MFNPVVHRIDWDLLAKSSLRPDVTIVAGAPQNAVKFLAHKRVLSDRSGYFKTLFAADGQLCRNEGETRGDYLREIRVVNIAAHTFACLLSFMYTSHLEVNPINVYELFLASDLLHISEALELCDRYIKRNRDHPSAAAVVRPIPRRTIGAVPSAAVLETTRKLQYQPLRVNNAALAASPSVFKPFRMRTVALDRENEENATATVVVDGVPGANETKMRQTNTAAATTTTTTLKLAHLVENNNCSKKLSATVEDEGGIIVDVACCDGPIRLRRVANSNYDPMKAADAKSCRGCGRVRPKSRHSGGSDCDAEDSSSTTWSSSSVSRTRIIAVAVECKRRQKDSNCYQCKTCGCKFPSYYFVHKHRKLHHADANSSGE